MPKRIDHLTDAQRARMDAWADEWIGIGLRTGPADRSGFEAAAKQCYEFAGIPWPNNVVWVPSPIVLAIAAPVAALVIQLARAKGPRGAVDDAVRGAVDDAVRGAVDGAVGGAVRGAVDGAVDADAIRRAVSDVIARGWANYIGGQLWPGGWYWGGAFTSFFREVCSLELEGDLWARGLAYEETIKSACWWYPHRDFVMVCERPTVINRELVNPSRPRGFGSHRLHCMTGPAVAWPDGWGVWAAHGVRVPSYVIDHPEQITVDQIRKEKNAEIRRVMVSQYGYERYIHDAKLRLVDHCPSDHELVGLRAARLYHDGDIVLLDMLNSTPEPDGTVKRYVLPVDPQAYGGRASKECLAAMASTWRRRSDPTQLFFSAPEEYAPVAES